MTASLTHGTFGSFTSLQFNSINHSDSDNHEICSNARFIRCCSGRLRETASVRAQGRGSQPGATVWRPGRRESHRNRRLRRYSQRTGCAHQDTLHMPPQSRPVPRCKFILAVQRTSAEFFLILHITQDLNANVAAGHAVNNTGVQLSFPTDNSQASQLARLNAATITLQNLFGPGVGCPQAATTFGAQAQAIRAGTAAPAPATTAAPASAPAAASTSTTSTSTTSGVDPNLVPQFGVEAGVNPTGTGDCDGIPNAQGVAIKIPCTCPPDRALFLAVRKSLSGFIPNSGTGC